MSRQNCTNPGFRQGLVNLHACPSRVSKNDLYALALKGFDENISPIHEWADFSFGGFLLGRRFGGGGAVMARSFHFLFGPERLRSFGDKKPTAVTSRGFLFKAYLRTTRTPGGVATRYEGYYYNCRAN
jgi:hypothetical protein